MGRIGGRALSPQQARCIELVGDGLTTKEIAFALSLSENTVDEHVKKAMAKLGAPNRMRAAAMHRTMRAPTLPQAPAAPEAAQPPAPHQPEGVGISPIYDSLHPAAPMATTMLLKDGDDAPFEGFPSLPMQPRQPKQPEQVQDAQDRLTIVWRVLSIASAIVLILVATPSLVSGAEQIAAWLRTTSKIHP